MMNTPAMFILAFYIFIIIIGFVINKVVIKTKKNNDSGLFWMKNLFWVSIFSLISFVIYCYFEDLLFAVVGDWRMISLVMASLWILGMFLPSSFIEHWEKGLIGTLSRKLDRKWILWPLFIPLLLSALLIPSILENYSPLYLYNFLFFILIDLFFIAFSQDLTNKVENSATIISESGFELKDWTSCLKAVEIKCNKIYTLSPTNTENHREIKNLEIKKLAKNKISYRILESMDKMLSPDNKERSGNLHKIIAAADYSGQIEIVYKAAEILFLRHFTVTLLVTPHLQDKIIADELKVLLHGRNIFTWTNQSNLAEIDGTIVIVIDIKELSDTFIDRLVSTEGYVYKIGLVVWWNIDIYKDIVASNVSAISRRLHRVIKLHGRKDARTLIFIRPSEYRESDSINFIKGFFPFSVSENTLVKINTEVVKTVNLYTLAFENDNRDGLDDLFFSALKGSIKGGWKTSFNKLNNYLSVIDNQNFIANYSLEHGIMNLTKSDAQIITIDEYNVLSFLERISNSGRETSNTIHNIGIITKGNPYVDYLIDLFTVSGKIPHSPLFIVPIATENIVSKHLMKILKGTSLPLSVINRDFQFSKHIIEKTLHNIDEHQYGVNVENVRYLKNNNERMIESAYKSKGDDLTRRVPLDCIGKDLIEILESADGNNEGSVRFFIDKERAAIKAYPGCVFFVKGHRYRIDSDEKSWSQNFKKNKTIHCSIEQNSAKTWRIYTSFLTPKTKITMSQNQGNLNYLLIDLNYKEFIYGFLKSDFNNNFIPASYNTVSTEFDTRALVIGFKGSNDGIRAISVAFKQLLIVHLAINEDVLQICSLTDDSAFPVMIGEQIITGIALVELYAGGIGLVDKLYKNQAFLANIFLLILNWLSESDADDQCVKWLNEVHFDQTDQQVSKKEAQNILNKIVN